MKTPESLVRKLSRRGQDGALRKLMTSDGLVDFYSNDYLGLARINKSIEGNHGSTGSRLISGNYPETNLFEDKLADFFNQESGLIFNSGYDANLGFFSCVPQRNDIVLYDELCHASIRDGIRLGLAKAYSFRHNDIDDLKEKLQKFEGDIYVVVEGVYSMDGDESPLEKIASLCKNSDAFLVVDEAHSGGIIGHEGVGMVSKLKLDKMVFAKLITFGKAYGAHGAIILGSDDLRTYLMNFARSLIYTTALPPSSIAAMSWSFNKVRKMDEERIRLEKNILIFKNEMKNTSIKLINGYGPIQSVVISGNENVKNIARMCQDEGFAVKAILAPTVPSGSERVRVCLHSYNSRDEILNLVKCLRKKEYS